MEEIISRIQRGETDLLEKFILDNTNIIAYYTKKYENIFEDYSLERILDYVDSEIAMERIQNSSLTKREKEYMYLKYQKNLTDGEIAKILGITIKAVYERKGHAYEKIGRFLSKRHK